MFLNARNTPEFRSQGEIKMVGVMASFLLLSSSNLQHFITQLMAFDFFHTLSTLNQPGGEFRVYIIHSITRTDKIITLVKFIVSILCITQIVVSLAIYPARTASIQYANIQSGKFASQLYIKNTQAPNCKLHCIRDNDAVLITKLTMNECECEATKPKRNFH